MRRKRASQKLIEDGDNLLREDDFDGAEQRYRQALQKDAASVEAIYSLGCVASRRGDHDAAGQWAERAIRQDPRYKPARYLLGNSLFARERHQEALNVLLDADPAEDDHRAIAQIGMLREKLGRWQEAESAFRSVLEQISSSYLTRYDVIAMHDHSPFSADLHHALARVLQRQGNRDEAWLHYHLARRVDPTTELDPMYREILTEEDVENHPSFDRQGTPNPGVDAELAHKLQYVLGMAEYDDVARAVREVGLDGATQDLAHMIQAAQATGHIVLSARVRLVADVANREDGTLLHSVLKSANWLRLLEIAEEHHAGRVAEAEALALARRVRADAATAVPFAALVRRFVRLQPETGRSVALVAKAALERSTHEALRGYGAFLWGEYCFAAARDHDAETELRAACERFFGAGDVVYATTAFEKLAQLQQQRGEQDGCVETCARFLELARRSGDPHIEIDALGVLAQHQAMNGRFDDARATALEATTLVRSYGAPTHVREGLERMLRHLGEIAGVPLSGSPVSSLADMIDQARDFLVSGRFQDALPVLEQAQARALETNQFTDLVQVLFLVGCARRGIGDIAGARAALKEALGRGEPLTALIDLTPILTELAETAEQEGDQKTAISYAERALAEARRRNDRQSQALCHRYLSKLFANVDEQRAVEHLGRFLELSPREKDEANDDSDTFRSAREAFERRDYVQAVLDFERFLAAAPASSRQRPGVIRNLALARFATGDAQAALRGLLEAADAFEEQKEPAAAVDALDRALRIAFDARHNLSAIAQRIGEIARRPASPGVRRSCLTEAAVALADAERQTEAEAAALQALEIAESSDWRDRRDAMRCRTTLGRLLRATGRYEESVRHYEAALEFAHSLGDEPEEGTIRGWKAISHRYLHQLDDAIKEYKAAIKIAQHYRDIVSEATHRMNLVSTLLDLGQRDEARENALAALRLAERDGNRRVMDRVLSALVGQFRREELPPEVYSHLDSFEERAAASPDDFMRALGLTYRARKLILQGRLDEGSEAFENVMEIHRRRDDRYNLASSYLNRARELAAAGATERARGDAAEASQRAAEIQHRALALECDEFLLGLELSAGDEQRVEACLARVVEAWRQLRGTLDNDEDRVRFADRAVPLVERCVGFFLTLGRNERAFAMVEWGRAQALSDLVAAAGLRAMAEESVTLSPRVPAGVPDARRVLLEAEGPAVLLSLSYVDEHLVAMALRDEGELQVRRTAFTKQRIGDWLKTFRLEMHEYRGRGGMTWLDLATEFTGAFTDLIRQDDLAIFLLEEDLQVLPLAAMRLPGGDLLMERAAVAYAPSLTVLDQIRHRQVSRGEHSRLDVASIGIAFPDEALAVHQMVGGVAITGNSLDKSDLQKFVSDKAIVHVACHGHFDAELPLYSGLHLRSPSSPFLADILTVRDLVGWQLDTNLLVLSACETGLGEVATSEFLGLTRNLLAASADSVIATLWPVRRMPTRDFMLDLYRGISDAHKQSTIIDTARLLRAAQCRAAGSGDYYDWAAFKVIGWPSFRIPMEAA
jgi:tetratricopeptide (TPR) repeat protein